MRVIWYSNEALLYTSRLLDDNLIYALPRLSDNVQGVASFVGASSSEALRPSTPRVEDSVTPRLECQHMAIAACP